MSIRLDSIHISRTYGGCYEGRPPMDSMIRTAKEYAVKYFGSRRTLSLLATHADLWRSPGTVNGSRTGSSSPGSTGLRRTRTSAAPSSSSFGGRTSLPSRSRPRSWPSTGTRTPRTTTSDSRAPAAKPRLLFCSPRDERGHNPHSAGPGDCTRPPSRSGSHH